MFYALSWFVVFSLLALWSLAAWAFHVDHRVDVLECGRPGGRFGGDRGLARAGLARALDSTRIWRSRWLRWLSAFAPAIDAVLGWAPALEGGLSVAVWVVWGIGSVLLIVLGFLATGLIAVLRRRVSAPSTPSGSPAAAR